MKREHLAALARLMTGIGLLLLMLVFLRACLSPPPLPDGRYPAPQGGPPESSALPSRY